MNSKPSMSPVILYDCRLIHGSCNLYYEPNLSTQYPTHHSTDTMNYKPQHLGRTHAPRRRPPKTRRLDDILPEPDEEERRSARLGLGVSFFGDSFSTSELGCRFRCQCESRCRRKRRGNKGGRRERRRIGGATVRPELCEDEGG